MGVLRAKVLTASQIIASDVSESRREYFTKTTGIKTTAENNEVAGHSEYLLLSIKPQMAPDALKGIGTVASVDTCMISIMAGISCAAIEKHLGNGKSWKIIRTMPNTPMLVGEGMVGISKGQHASTENLNWANKLFAAGADIVSVNEEQIDAVTAVSGSGPAYFFYFIEHMIKSGVALGLDAEQARQLSIKTILGAAKMLQTSTDSPAELRRKVTSPAGTTHAAITHMEKNHVGETLQDAMTAAAKRSRELGA